MIKIKIKQNKQTKVGACDDIVLSARNSVWNGLGNLKYKWTILKGNVTTFTADLTQSTLTIPVLSCFLILIFKFLFFCFCLGFITF